MRVWLPLALALTASVPHGHQIRLLHTIDVRSCVAAAPQRPDMRALLRRTEAFAGLPCPQYLSTTVIERRRTPQRI